MLLQQVPIPLICTSAIYRSVHETDDSFFFIYVTDFAFDMKIVCLRFRISPELCSRFNGRMLS